jgi:hypothetical protein
MSKKSDEQHWPRTYGIYKCLWRGQWYFCYAYRRRGRGDLDLPGVVILINTGDWLGSGLFKYKMGEREAPCRFIPYSITETIHEG